MDKVIWQYWETRGKKPLFVDELHEIAKRNSGVEMRLVTPETLREYLPDIPAEITTIKEMAHKADMIRSLLIYRYGGMWLDSDAIVLGSLAWLFDLLSETDFVGFNDTGSFDQNPVNVRINCFLSKPKSKIMESWVTAQHAKLPRTVYSWTEIGTDLLDPIAIQYKHNVKLLPFRMICPVKWNEVERFSSTSEDAASILDGTLMIMLSNKSLEKRNPKLREMPLSQLIEENTLISAILRKAMKP